LRCVWNISSVHQWTVVQPRPATPSLLQFYSASRTSHSCVCVCVRERWSFTRPNPHFLQLPSATANSGAVEPGVQPRVLKPSRARFVCTRTCDTGAWLERVVGPVLKRVRCQKKRGYVRTGCIWSMQFQCNLGWGASQTLARIQWARTGRHSSNPISRRPLALLAARNRYNFKYCSCSYLNDE
jgi:hypothetical protein